MDGKDGTRDLIQNSLCRRCSNGIQKPIVSVRRRSDQVDMFLAPVVAFAAAAGIEFARHLVLTALLTFSIHGRFVILGGRERGAEAAGFTPEQLVLAVSWYEKKRLSFSRKRAVGVSK